jgi:hypothetical protein
MKIFWLVCLFLFSMESSGKESAEFAQKVINEHGLKGDGAAKLQKLLLNSEATRNIGTEDLTEIVGVNSAIHPASRQSCLDKVVKTGYIRRNAAFEKICGAKWMAPVPAPGQPVESAKVCIDQFEFPDIPCEYPVVWAPAAFAAKACEAMGKRMCNSHEWEGGCAGEIDDEDPYLFGLGSLNERRSVYNSHREVTWAFDWDSRLAGKKSSDLCAIYSPNDPDMDPRIQGHASKYYTSIGKSATCQTTSSDYKNCGSHTWPAGMKYLCSSKYGVYDMHGNVAEVTNFPVTKNGLAHGTVTDHTERKGSFFVVRKNYPDDCRVRQPYEHFNQVSTDKHSFYQEGFRCCKDVR